jgi:hypothetical protein
MRRLEVIVFIGALMVGGCASVDLAGELAKTLPAPTERAEDVALESEVIQAFERNVADTRRARFNAIGVQIKKGGPGPLPAELAKQPLLKAFVSALDRASRIPAGELAASAGDPELPSSSISATDGKKFAIALRDAVNPKTNERRNQVKAASDKSFFMFMGQYLEAYAVGEFVDGFGGKIGKPKFREGFKGIGNEAITGGETVFFELLADWVLQTPLFKDPANKWVTVEGIEPTASKVGLRSAVKVPETGQGLTVKRVHGLQCAATMAGEGGVLLSGAVVRFFGGVDAGQFVLGKFSIGDNERAMKVVETAFEIAFRRGIEHGVYKMFASPQLHAERLKEPDLGCLLNLL